MLLAAEGGAVEGVPGTPRLLVAAGVAAVGAQALVALADAGVGGVPVVDVDVVVDVVGDPGPGDVLGSVALGEGLDLGLGAREPNTRVVFRACRWAGWATWSATNEQPTHARSGEAPPPSG